MQHGGGGAVWKVQREHQATMCVAAPEEAAGKLGLTCPPKGLAMTVGRQPLVVRLTPAQALRMERMGECLWPTEKLSAAEVTWRLALTQLLWAESERGMVESVRTSA